MCMRLFLGTIPLFSTILLLTLHRLPHFRNLRDIFLRWVITLLGFIIIMLISFRGQSYSIFWIFFRDMMLPLLLGWGAVEITLVRIKGSSHQSALRIIVLGSYALVQAWIAGIYGGKEISILYHMFLLPCSIICWPAILGFRRKPVKRHWYLISILVYWGIALGIIILSFQYYFLAAIGSSILLLCGVCELVFWEYRLFWHAES